MSAENLLRSPRGGLLARASFGTRLALIVGLGLVVRLLHLFLVAGDNPLSGDAASYHLGANLFAESVVALNIETGEREWHFQAVHHGLWD